METFTLQNFTKNLDICNGKRNSNLLEIAQKKLLSHKLM